MNERELFKETFSNLHASDHTLEEVLGMAEKGRRGKRFVRKSTLIGLLAASIGTVALAATAGHWSRGLQHQLQGTTEAMQELEGKGIASFSDLSVTDEGVTVTLQQSIVNGAWGYVSFQVSGYELPEGAAPMFETADLTVTDWNGSFGISSHFDSGLLTDGYKVVGENGQEPETEEDGSLKMYWLDEEGNLEYIFGIYITDESGQTRSSLAGREVSVELAGLGFEQGKESCQVQVPGKWKFTFTLPGADESVCFTEIDKEIGDTGAVLKEVEISPISMSVMYEFPRKVLTETGYQEEAFTEADGAERYESVPFTYEYYEEPPYATGVRLKDGIILWGINAGPGSSGYTDEKGDIWVNCFGTGKILDAEQIASILFIDRETLSDQGEIDITEDNCIEVPFRS